MKTYIILGKNNMYLPIDLLSDTASDEVRSFMEQGFVIVCEECKAENSKIALETWKVAKSELALFQHIQTSTTHTLVEGMKIIGNKGVLTATVVAGTNILRDILGSVRDIVGGNSTTYISKLDQIKSQSLLELRKQADELGCNAVIGVSIDVDEISGGGKSMFMVTATGTAVCAEQRT